MTAPRGTDYAELQVTTHFSFLRGASSVEELFAEAALLGIGALGITDRHSLAGIVRAHEAAKVTGVRARRRLPARPDRRRRAAGLSDRPRRLWPALPSADPGQGARRQGRLRAGLG